MDHDQEQNMVSVFPQINKNVSSTTQYNATDTLLSRYVCHTAHPISRKCFLHINVFLRELCL